MRHRRTRLILKDALASSTAFSTVSSFSDKIISTWQGQFLKHQKRSCSITCMIKISACQIIGIAGIAWECAQNPELVWGRHMYGPIRPWARYVRLRPCWAAFTSSSCRRIKKNNFMQSKLKGSEVIKEYERIWKDMKGYERIWKDMKGYERIWKDKGSELIWDLRWDSLVASLDVLHKQLLSIQVLELSVALGIPAKMRQVLLSLSILKLIQKLHKHL